MLLSGLIPSDIQSMLPVYDEIQCPRDTDRRTRARCSCRLGRSFCESGPDSPLAAAESQQYTVGSLENHRLSSLTPDSSSIYHLDHSMRILQNFVIILGPLLHQQQRNCIHEPTMSYVFSILRMMTEI